MSLIPLAAKRGGKLRFRIKDRMLAKSFRRLSN